MQRIGREVVRERIRTRRESLAALSGARRPQIDVHPCSKCPHSIRRIERSRHAVCGEGVYEAAPPIAPLV
jgi:hypothetical protein